MEGDREGVRVEAPKGPLGQAPVEGKGNGSSFGLPAGHEDLVYGQVAARGGGGGGSEREEDGPGPPSGEGERGALL